MKIEDLHKIAAEAAHKINPSIRHSIEQMESSTHPEIRLGLEVMKQTRAKSENIIAGAIREALLLESGEAFLELSAAQKRVKELEEALSMLTTWAKTDGNEPEGDITHLVEVVIEHARKVLGLDENFQRVWP